MAIYKPSTLAKTLAYILHHAPEEHGLFWNPDRTMPWKEFYWALQEDPSLRFVRESHIHEIGFLGIEFPARLEGRTLHLREGYSPHPMEPLSQVPLRLHFACGRKAYFNTLEHGLRPGGRPFVPLFAHGDLALRVGKRRDPKSILLEIDALSALRNGVPFWGAGQGMFLVETLPSEHLLAPQLKESVLLELAHMGKKEKIKEAAPEKAAPHSPGSFFLEARHLKETGGRSSPQDRKQKGKYGPDWKKAARKDRGKRSV